MNFWSNSTLQQWICGGSRIRTYGPLLATSGFQDRCNRPSLPYLHNSLPQQFICISEGYLNLIIFSTTSDCIICLILQWLCSVFTLAFILDKSTNFIFLTYSNLKFLIGKLPQFVEKYIYCTNMSKNVCWMKLFNSCSRSGIRTRMARMKILNPNL